MAILALSDLLVATTLLVNAGACLKFKLPSSNATQDTQQYDASPKAAALSLLASLRVFR